MGLAKLPVANSPIENSAFSQHGLSRSVAAGVLDPPAVMPTISSVLGMAMHKIPYCTQFFKAFDGFQ